MTDVAIWQGDCLERMRDIPDASVSLIATDPPYFKVADEDWDHQWDGIGAFLVWMGRLCAEWKRVLAPNGSLYVFASPEMAWHVEGEIRKQLQVLNHIVWPKSDMATHALKYGDDRFRQFVRKSERIVFAQQYDADSHADGVAGYSAKCDELRGFLFEPIRAYLDAERLRAGMNRKAIDAAWQRTRGTKGEMFPHWFTAAQFGFPTSSHYAFLRETLNARGGDYLARPYGELLEQYEDLRREYEDMRRPFSVDASVPYTDVWDYPTVPARPGKHPCEKPLAMMEHIVRASSRPGDLVLDCFAGSGVTGRACRNLGRRCILIEKDPHWARAAEIWLDRPHAYLPREKKKGSTSLEMPLFQAFGVD